MDSDRKAAVIILIRGTSTLLQLRDNKPDISHPGHWAVLGGMVEEGEDVKDAAIRELKEETGYVSQSPIKFMVELYTSPTGDRVEAHRFYEIYDETQEVQCYEGQKIAWIELKDIDKLKMIETQRYAVKAAIRLAQQS